MPRGKDRARPLEIDWSPPSVQTWPMSSDENTRTGELPNEPVGVIAVGVEGRATIDYLLAHGVEDITAMDARVIEGLPEGIETAFGEGYDRDLHRFATIFKSPGIRPDHPELVSAARGGTRVLLCLMCRACRSPGPVMPGAGA